MYLAWSINSGHSYANFLSSLVRTVQLFVNSLEVRRQHLLVSELSATHGTRVSRLHSALVFQMLDQRVPPPVLSSAILAGSRPPVATTLFSHVPIIRRLPDVALSAYLALIHTVAGYRAPSRGELPP